MAFARPHSSAADATFSATGAAAWNANQTPTGADVGGIPYCPTATTETTSANFLYTETSGPRLQVGTSNGTSQGIIVGYAGSSGQSGIWSTRATPSDTNYLMKVVGANELYIGAQVTASGYVATTCDGSNLKFIVYGTAGRGPSITAGTATTDVQALAATQTWNASGVAFTGWKFTITDTASAAGSVAMQILGGASGTTELFKLTKSGALTIPAGLTIGAGDIAYIQYLYSIDNTTSIRLNQSNGIIQLASGSSGSGFDRLQFGGTTSSFPAIKRSTTVLQARLADDSAAATFQGKYNSSDGTAGVTSFGPGAVTSITIKDGLVVAIS